MAKRVGPRRGSRAFRPRKRAERLNPRINAFPTVEELRLLDFLVFKAGMSQVSFIETREGPAKGTEVVKAVTVLEAPKSICYGIRYLKDGQVEKDLLVSDEKILKPLGIKNVKSTEQIKSFNDVRLLVYSLVSSTKIGQKKPIIYEIAIGSSDPVKKEEYAKTFLGKEIKISDVFKKGEHIDVVGVTKGKGWQGAVKRFGVAIQRRKATGKRRHVGTLGPWHPPYVMYTVPMAGQMGFHKRTEQNKRVLEIINERKTVEKINNFHKYGFIKTEAIVVEGSVPGPQKRMLKLKLSNRNSNIQEPVELISRMYIEVR